MYNKLILAGRQAGRKTDRQTERQTEYYDEKLHVDRLIVQLDVVPGLN